ncbi:hypothetical protein LCGC14_2146110 [marine sediment metagenome]|uniref:Uncharacterized protein n=1 Tax=marine sediment metagenome TaxID=412755 RepID=A0A0F9DWV8_9ZZZZ
MALSSRCLHTQGSHQTGNRRARGILRGRSPFGFRRLGMQGNQPRQAGVECFLVGGHALISFPKLLRNLLKGRVWKSQFS